MIQKFQCLLIIIILTALPVNLYAQEKDLQINDAEKTIIDLTNNLAKSWEELNVTKYINHFSSELKFYFEGTLIDYDTLKGIVQGTMPNLKKTTFQIIKPKVLYADSKLGVISFNLKETFLDNSENYEELNAVLTLIWENNIEWKITVAYESISQIHSKN